MKDVNAPIAFPDEVDRIVDKMLSNPNEVEALKEVLRQRIAGRGPLRQPCAAHRAAEPDDLWDNMPI